MKRMRAALTGLLLSLLLGVAWAEGGAELSVRQKGRVRAPELTGGRGWLNSDKPLSLAALRGKVVLLDFWTYGCINCIHVIPDLKRLEAKYANQLVVIGVHSGKFPNERETENIRRVVMRYGVEHPVVNDADFKIWQAYAVNAWPTQVLIDPAGYVVGQVAGEGHYDALDQTIGELIVEFRGRGQLDEQPLKLALERASVGALPLAFPGKLLADERGERLFISDSNHHRIVVCRLDGTFLYAIGSGEEGFDDGEAERARFRGPQGLALDGETLYVADTGNHSIRRVDLKARTVETIAGTGAQLRHRALTAGPARSIALSSPWDLQLVGRTLYIAMAGPHQIWQLDLRRAEVSVFAGTGLEARMDGPRDESAFAQPSGLATDGRMLYVADSESNIIRSIGLTDEPESKAAGAKGEANAAGAKEEGARVSLPSISTAHVRTLAGGDLFDFGDRDGRGDHVRLQHPLGVVFHDGRLFIADTYNHKIKTLDPRTGDVRTFAGTGRAGQQDGSRATFYEPGGISFANGKLYVADTNNHAVRVIDIRTREARTLALRGLQPPPAATARTEEESRISTGPNPEDIKVGSTRIATGDVTLTVDVTLPEGHHLSDTAPHRYVLAVEGAPTLVPLDAATSGAGQLSATGGGKNLRLPLRFALKATEPGEAGLRVSLTIYYCREDNTGLCRIKTLRWNAPIIVTGDAGATREIKLHAKVE